MYVPLFGLDPSNFLINPKQLGFCCSSEKVNNRSLPALSMPEKHVFSPIFELASRVQYTFIACILSVFL
jgi:hypothetical protein